MAKKKTTKKKSTKKKSSRKGSRSQNVDATDKHLVIVESPTKARTINRYLGPDYAVMASVGHVRDLPKSPPKGAKRKDHPVPGVDLEHGFKPSYEVLPDKKKTVSELKKAAKQAKDVWFATDLDREGEAIAWHLAEALGVDSDHSRRVVFNAITKSEIERAFESPRAIDGARVNAQQARRILDRIVGYQVSPLLWKKVAGGLSAGRVQSVATRLVVDREREIEAFIPDEYWKISALLSVDPAQAARLAEDYLAFVQEGEKEAEKKRAEGDGRATGRTVKQLNAWLSRHECLKAELVELAGEGFKPEHRDDALEVAEALGFSLTERIEKQDPKGKGPAKQTCVFQGAVDQANAPEYKITSIETKRTSSRPPGPFITSTMQQAASNRLGFPLQRTMRIAQQLYEGIDLKAKRGQTGLITYMRTDSTHLSGDALNMARGYIEETHGNDYLPKKPNFFSSSNKSAQEAHEAIRPTDVTITPQSIKSYLSDEQFKLYELIWKRFLACQMMPAQWDSTTVHIEAKTSKGNAKFKSGGRKLVFDGFYKVTGVPQGDDVVLPHLEETQPLGLMKLDPTQHFTNPPPRYTEASLQKKLEEEGIGRPSTYAAIISTIQARKYVEPLMPRDRRMRATDLGKVVTDKLMEAFPRIMDVGYTREMEAHLDEIETDELDWVKMLEEFYGPFKTKLDTAMENMTHAKAETEPAPHKCETCGAPTEYRFGKNGKFLSCTRYPDCKYAAPIDSEGNPQQAEVTDVLCPEDGEPLIKRNGRFGPFLASQNYPDVKFILKLDPKKGTVVLPKTEPMLSGITCPKCEERELYVRDSKRGLWLSCSGFPKCRGRVGFSKLDEEKQKELEDKWAKHQNEHPTPDIYNSAGEKIEEGYEPTIAGQEPAESDAA